MPPSTCLAFYAVLTVVVWAALFLRASRKRVLIAAASKYFESTPQKDAWSAAATGIWAHLGDWPCLRLVKQHQAVAPAEVQAAYRRYFLTSRAAYCVLVLLIALALAGFRLCS